MTAIAEKAPHWDELTPAERWEATLSSLGFFVRDLPLEEAVEKLLSRGMTADEYIRRWNTEAEKGFSLQPPSVLMFSREPSRTDGWRIWWDKAPHGPDLLERPST